MKALFKYIYASLAVGCMVACQPEEFEGASQAGLPEAKNYQVVADVDQTINQVVIDLVDASNQHAKGVFPVITIELPDGSTEILTTYSKIYAKSGDYKVTVKVGNHNGISDGELTTTFHMDNSIVDYTRYFTMISNAPWYLDNTAKGHIACGPNINDPAGWWSAGPDEKAAFGVYDNSLTFTKDGKYTFNPGEAGTVYANKCVTALGVTGASEDYTVEAAEATYEYSFDIEGDDLILVLAPKGWFPYIASDQIYETPRYKVVNMTTKAMTLASYQVTPDNKEGIAWQYILSTSHEVKFAGFKYDQENNIWKNSEITAGGMYYADGGWTPYPDVNQDEIFSVTNQETSVNLVKSTEKQWQAQFPILTDIGPNDARMTSAKKYDFSCVITASKDLESMTLKLVETGDNGVPGSLGIAYDENAVFYSPDNKLKAYEDYVFYLVDQPGVDIQDNLLQLVMDFGGCEEGTEVTVKNIVLIEHDLNTELDKLPSDTPSDTPSDDPSTPQVSWTGTNLLTGMPVEITQHYAPNWEKIEEGAEYTAENGVYNIKYPIAAGSQWMAQFTFNNTGIALDPNKTYDFRVKIVSTTDHPGVTVKLTQQDDDDTYITADQHSLVAYEETWIELVDLKLVGKGEISNLKMPFDFGGIEAGTEITISDMHLQEHQEGPKAFAWDLTGEKNLWLKGTHETLSYHYAPGWNKIDDPVGVIDGNKYTITLPTATENTAWQAQWHISTELGKADISADKKYNIRFTIESNQDLPGVTFKLTENGNDDNFLTADRHAVVAFEETTIELMDLTLPKGDITNETFKLALDFAGNPADTEVTVKDIIIQEAE